MFLWALLCLILLLDLILQLYEGNDVDTTNENTDNDSNTDNDETCTDLKCLNGGFPDHSCLSCVCPRGFDGVHCENNAICDEKIAGFLCKNDGELQGTYPNCECLCENGWSGKKCDVCELDCNGHGKAKKNKQGNCVCECNVCYKGEFCEKEKTELGHLLHVTLHPDICDSDSDIQTNKE